MSDRAVSLRLTEEREPLPVVNSPAPRTSAVPSDQVMQEVSFERFEPEDRPRTTYENTIIEITILFVIVSVFIFVGALIRMQIDKRKEIK